jgi:hypothetical protein
MGRLLSDVWNFQFSAILIHNEASLTWTHNCIFPYKNKCCWNDIWETFTKHWCVIRIFNHTDSEESLVCKTPQWTLDMLQKPSHRYWWNSLWETFTKRCWVIHIFSHITQSIYPPTHLHIYGSTVLVDLGRFFSFLILLHSRKDPWSGNQPVARSVPTRRTIQTE